MLKRLNHPNIVKYKLPNLEYLMYTIIGNHANYIFHLNMFKRTCINI
jgi:hypothetical protein